MVAPTDDPDRPRGILSPADREYLLASAEEREENYSRQARTKRKAAIRERVRNAILDFSLLWEHWDGDEQERVFDELGSDEHGREGLADMISLFYLETRFSAQFNALFSRGVRRAEDRLAGGGVEYAVNVKPVNEIVQRIKHSTTEQAIEKLGKGVRGIRDMNDSELRMLVHLLRYSGYSREEFREMQEELTNRLQDYAEEHADAVETRQKNAREKQFGSSDEEE